MIAGWNSLFVEWNMTTAVQELLNAFESLPQAERHEAAVEILRRAFPGGAGDVPESALIDSADELFRALDAEEEMHAGR
jgi:hypothetical protein